MNSEGTKSSKFSIFYQAAGFVLAVIGAIFISAAFSALVRTVVSYFDLPEIGAILTYPILTLVYLPLFTAYFGRYVAAERLKSKRSLHALYLLTSMVPALFVSGRYFEGTVLLAIVFSISISGLKF